MSGKSETPIPDKEQLHSRRVAKISSDRVNRLNKIKGLYSESGGGEKGIKKSDGTSTIKERGTKLKNENIDPLFADDSDEKEKLLDDPLSMFSGENSLLKEFIGGDSKMNFGGNGAQQSEKIMGFKAAHLRKTLFLVRFVLVTLFVLLYVQNVNEILKYSEFDDIEDSAKFSSIWSKTVREIFLRSHPGFITMKFGNFEFSAWVIFLTMELALNSISLKISEVSTPTGKIISGVLNFITNRIQDRNIRFLISAARTALSIVLGIYIDIRVLIFVCGAIIYVAKYT